MFFEGLAAEREALGDDSLEGAFGHGPGDLRHDPVVVDVRPPPRGADEARVDRDGEHPEADMHELNPLAIDQLRTKAAHHGRQR